MKTTLHTPAPWSVKKASPQAGIIIAPNRSLGIAEVFGGGETDIANARLIASAPDLLLALETLLSDRSCPSFLTLDEWHNTHLDFRSTLRKAKGEA
jgi:hypothetical protein